RHDRNGDRLCSDYLHHFYSAPIRRRLEDLFENPYPVVPKNLFDLIVAETAGLALLGPPVGGGACSVSGCTHLLPRSWGTVIVTLSLEELPHVDSEDAQARWQGT